VGVVAAGAVGVAVWGVVVVVWGVRLGGALGGGFVEASGEGDALAREVDGEDLDLDAVAGFDDVVGVGDELGGELGDVDEAVLVDADVDEGAEVGDVGDDAFEGHVVFEVGDGEDVVAEGEGVELLAGVAAGFAEFVDDVVEGGFADVVGGVGGDVDALGGVGVADELGEGEVEVLGDAFDEGVAFGVDGGGVEGVGGVVDAEEAGGLLEGAGADAGDVEELLA
jgi:hypothetical protein